MNVGANNMMLKRRQRKVTKHANPEKSKVDSRFMFRYAINTLYH